MKKIIVAFILTLFLFVNQTSAFNYDSVYKKIDIIYNKSPEKLEVLKDKLVDYLEKNKNKKFKNIIYTFINYIDFKLKNKDFYNQKVSKNLKKEINDIYYNSFTDIEVQKKLERLKNKNKYFYLEKEYLDIIILLNKIAINLNYQNFDNAKSLIKSIFENKNSYKLEFLAKNLDYKDFGTLIQFISFENKELKKSIINYRLNYFPDEKNTAYNMVRKYGYKGLDCEKLVVKNENLDLIDKKFCKIINQKFEEKDLKDLEKLDNNLQNLSDRTNYYSYVGKIKGNFYYSQNMKKKLGNTIIQNNPNFVNGYFILIGYFDQKKDCEKVNEYYKKLQNNYLGDENRKKVIYNFVEKLDNCSIKNNKF